MAEPVLLTLRRSEWDAMWRLAGRGEQWAIDGINALWDGYEDQQPIACFICDRPTGWPPHTQILPESGDPSRLVAAPLCATWAELSSLQRFNRALALLREMWKRQGKQLHYDFSPQRHHPRRSRP